MESTSLRELLATMPQRGRVEWIGLRPERAAPVVAVTEVHAHVGSGLEGDHHRGTPESKRQVTLIQAEHLKAIASILGRPAIDPALLRRNIVVAGINVYALRNARFRIGEVLLEGTGECQPCSWMEQAFGPGGYNAIRGHGGITARVLAPGDVRIGAEVALTMAGPGD